MKWNKDAVFVKIADLKHNSDITCLKELTEKDVQRMVKYHSTYLDLIVSLKE